MSDGHIRLLQCMTCRSLEELPDFTGRPEDDVLLHYVDENHGGHTDNPHDRALHRVEDKHWRDPAIRRQITREMWRDTKGFVPAYYDTRNTLLEDAAKCFKKHHFSVPCLDYQDPSKRIGNPASRLRKQVAKEMRRDASDFGPGPKVFLCNFCPVQSHVDRMKLAIDPSHKF